MSGVHTDRYIKFSVDLITNKTEIDVVKQNNEEKREYIAHGRAAHEGKLCINSANIAFVDGNFEDTVIVGDANYRAKRFVYQLN